MTFVSNATASLIYIIDCHGMVQWNVRTHRTREIRRGEARPDVTLLIPKLAEKDAEVERLRTEKSNWVGEKEELQKSTGWPSTGQE